MIGENVNVKDSNRPEGCYYYEGNPDGKVLVNGL